MHITLVAFAIGYIALANGAAILNDFSLSIIHLNDFHARFEEVNSQSQTCSDNDAECYGGFSRLYAEINKRKEQHPGSIVLDAGDNYQGTIWYRMYKWRAVEHFMNKIPFDVHTIGNHEFDDKISGLVPLLERFKAPAVLANIDDSEEPSLHGLLKKSVVIERNGLRIGVIGAILTSTGDMSATENVKFLDESKSINKEAERLVAEEYVDTIIVLSHCGYDLDKIIAKNAAPKIGLIVGGHSHTLLYSGTPPKPFEAEGDYPTAISHKDGRQILIVQALAHTQFLGHLDVNYNSNGDVLSWTGAPIQLNAAILQDEEINKEIDEWKSSLEEYEKAIIGQSYVHLDSKNCRVAECNIGNLLADSLVYAFSDSNSLEPIVSLMNSGGIRNSLNTGDITFAHLIEVQPFENTFDIAELQGKYIKEALEHAATPFSQGGKGMLQVSGINVKFNVTNEIGSRVESLKVWCGNCAEPSYEDIDMEKYYRVACNSFLMSGKDGFNMIANNIINLKYGEVDVEVVSRYIKQQSPIAQTTDGRITIVW